MRLAILSDIHGNAPALRAVLEDIKKENIDQTIFLGDYFGEFSQPNEVFDLMRNHRRSFYVSGNKERYFEQEHFQDPSLWTYDQFQLLYWNHGVISPYNHAFMKSLPVTLNLKFSDTAFTMTHDGFDFFESVALKSFTSGNYAYLMPASKAAYLAYVDKTLRRSPSFLKELEAMKAQVILFGHSHIQWHAHIGGKWIINPGSVGMPLDMDPGAAYSIVEVKKGTIGVTEKVIAYDTQETIEALKANRLYSLCPFWSDMGIEQLETGCEFVSFFFKHLSNVKRALDAETKWPLDNDVFLHAVKTWPQERAKMMPVRQGGKDDN